MPVDIVENSTTFSKPPILALALAGDNLGADFLLHLSSGLTTTTIL